MATMTTTWARSLTDEEIDGLFDDADRTAAATIIRFFTLACGETPIPLDDRREIKPWEFALPEAQWLDIAGRLVARYGEQGGLQWMNSGPGSS